MNAPFPMPDADAASVAVRLRDVGKTFANGTEALRGVDLDIARGSFVSLLGPLGCGKSTVLRLVADLAWPTTGRIAYPDRDAGRRSARPEIGFVFQEPTLMPWATVAGNVRLPLRIKRVKRAEADALVADALERVGLAEFAHVYPRELSGGMKMRVSIARALVTRPDVLLMDEPFAALDEITRFRLNDDLLQLWEDTGWTVLFVTHSVFESVYLSERIVVMAPRPGRIHADIRVATDHPRDEAFRTAPDYNRYCREASAALHGAMETPTPAEVHA